jgi:peptidoglycan/xylan/chitin deacetylase (PgdA/CDA1 family)
MLTFKNVNIVFATLGGVVIISWLSYGTSLFWLLPIVLLWLVLTTIGAFHIRWNYFVNGIHSNPGSKNQVSLTFDDGPDPKHTPEILDLLKKHNAKATFFCIGKNVERYPELARRISKDGHIIGNHSYGHSENFGFLSKVDIIKDLQRCSKVIQEAIGKETLLFRPPFGVTNPSISKAISSLALTCCGWSIRSLDTRAKSHMQILDKIIPRVQPGSVILLHDTNRFTVKALEELLILIEKRRMEAVSLESLFNLKAYAY